jgi:hypothetical protein
MGFATRSVPMFSSSHIDSTMRWCVAVTNRRRQRADMAGTVRAHSSARAASAGLAGSGGLSDMNSSSRSR